VLVLDLIKQSVPELVQLVDMELHEHWAQVQEEVPPPEL
jgi:hypothetical protein